MKIDIRIQIKNKINKIQINFNQDKDIEKLKVAVKSCYEEYLDHFNKTQRKKVNAFLQSDIKQTEIDVELSKIVSILCKPKVSLLRRFIKFMRSLFHFNRSGLKSTEAVKETVPVEPEEAEPVPNSDDKGMPSIPSVSSPIPVIQVSPPLPPPPPPPPPPPVLPVDVLTQAKLDAEKVGITKDITQEELIEANERIDAVKVAERKQQEAKARKEVAEKKLAELKESIVFIEKGLKMSEKKQQDMEKERLYQAERVMSLPDEKIGEKIIANLDSVCENLRKANKNRLDKENEKNAVSLAIDEEEEELHLAVKGLNMAIEELAIVSEKLIPGDKEKSNLFLAKKKVAAQKAKQVKKSNPADEAEKIKKIKKIAKNIIEEHSIKEKIDEARKRIVAEKSEGKRGNITAIKALKVAETELEIKRIESELEITLDPQKRIALGLKIKSLKDGKRINLSDSDSESSDDEWLTEENNKDKATPKPPSSSQSLSASTSMESGIESGEESTKQTDSDSSNSGDNDNAKVIPTYSSMNSSRLSLSVEDIGDKQSKVEPVKERPEVPPKPISSVFYKEFVKKELVQNTSDHQDSVERRSSP